MQLRLDSWAYRFIWQIKRWNLWKSLKIRWDPGPFPIRWTDPCHQFVPPPNFQHSLDVVKSAANFETLTKELEVLSRITNYLPKVLSEQDWHKLCQLTTSKERFEHLQFLHKRAKRRIVEEQKDRMRKDAVEQWRRELEGKRMEERGNNADGEWGRLISRTTNSDIDSKERHLKSQRSIQAFRLIDEYPRIAVDCRWLTSHSSRGLNLAAKQLKYLLTTNRDRDWPWPLFLCNFPASGEPKMEDAKRNHLNLLDSPNSFLAHVTAQSYLDLFPELRAQQKIVYLSPHSKEPLQSVEAGTCYVIGGIVDRVLEPDIPSRATLMTAEEEELPCRKLPIAPGMLRGGHSMFTLDQVLSVLQDAFESGGDWQAAIERRLPKRKFTPPVEKNQAMVRRYANFRRTNREILRIIESATAGTAPASRKETTMGLGRLAFGKAAAALFWPQQKQLRQFHTPPSSSLQRRYFSSSPSEAAKDAHPPVPQKEKPPVPPPLPARRAEEGASLPEEHDGTIRREPFKKVQMTKNEREKQFWLHMYAEIFTNIDPSMQWDTVPRRNYKYMLGFGAWILLDLLLLGLIWRLEKKKGVSMDDKQKDLTQLTAIFLLQNFFLFYLFRWLTRPTFKRNLRKKGQAK